MYVLSTSSANNFAILPTVSRRFHLIFFMFKGLTTAFVLRDENKSNALYEKPLPFSVNNVRIFFLAVHKLFSFFKQKSIGTINFYVYWKTSRIHD